MLNTITSFAPQFRQTSLRKTAAPAFGNKPLKADIFTPEEIKKLAETTEGKKKLLDTAGNLEGMKRI